MLKINMEYRKGVLFVRLFGELTKYTYKSLNDYLIPVIKNQGIKYIVYNIQNIKKIDIYGKECLYEGIEATRKNLGNGLICSSNIKFKENYEVTESELTALQKIII